MITEKERKENSEIDEVAFSLTQRVSILHSRKSIMRGKIKCLKKIFLRKPCSLSNLANIGVNPFSEFNATRFSV